MESGSKETGKLAVALSALLPANQDQPWYERDKFLAAYDKLAAERGKAIPDLFAQIDAEFAEFAPVLKLPRPRNHSSST